MPGSPIDALASPGQLHSTTARDSASLSLCGYLDSFARARDQPNSRTVTPATPGTFGGLREHIERPPQRRFYRLIAGFQVPAGVGIRCTCRPQRGEEPGMTKDRPLEGKVAIVTGGANGIGARIFA